MSAHDPYRNSGIIDRFNRNKPDAPTYLKTVEGKMHDSQTDTEKKKRKYVKASDKVPAGENSIDINHRNNKKVTSSHNNSANNLQ